MSSKLKTFLGFLSFPYKDFVELERSRKLLVIHAAACCLSVLVFFAYVAFSTSIYLRSPEPSQLSVESIYPSNPPKALFEFSIFIPLNFTTCDPNYPTGYRSPFSNTLTLLPKSPYVVKAGFSNRSYENLSFYYDCYTFPVYGTVDANTFSSTLLIFNPCSYSGSGEAPLLFSVHDVTASPPRFKSLVVTLFNFGQDFIFTETATSAESAEFIPLFDDFDESGPDIGIEILLARQISSSKDSNYQASIFAPPSYSPSSTTPKKFLPRQRSLVITVKPAISVITKSPKNILTFIGALGGIFPVCLAIGSFISSCIWSNFVSQKSDPLLVPLNAR